MPNLHKEKSQWLLELNSGDNILLYQPKVKPSDELSLLEKIFTNYPIEKAFYTKISVHVSGEIMDYHLVALETKSTFIFDNLLPDLISSKKILSGFKFLDLASIPSLSKEIRRSNLFYKK